MARPRSRGPTPAEHAETADSLSLAFDAHDRLVGVIGLDIADGQIQTIHSIANPDKLRHLDRVSDLAALLRAGRRPGDG